MQQYNPILKGDQILCVDDNIYHYLEAEAEITIGKIYECNYIFSSKEGVFIRFHDDKGQDRCALSSKFINCSDPANMNNIKGIKLSLLKKKMIKLLKTNKVKHG